VSCGDLAGLEAIARDIEQGKFRWQAELEDVHMNIEAALTRRVPAGAKLHHGSLAQRPGRAGYAALAPGTNRGVKEGN